MSRPKVVVDASVAVKWVLPEDDTERALRLQEKYQDEQLDVLAPYLVVSEVANVLWKRERRGDLSVAAAQRAFAQFLHDSPRFCSIRMPSATQRWAWPLRIIARSMTVFTWPGPSTSNVTWLRLTRNSFLHSATSFLKFGCCEHSESESRDGGRANKPSPQPPIGSWAITVRSASICSALKLAAMPVPTATWIFLPLRSRTTYLPSCSETAPF